MKMALVLGAAGFIGGHLTKRLKDEGYFVVGVDQVIHPWSDIKADKFTFADLRYDNIDIDGYDEIYQLAADFGGMGYIEHHPYECLTNNVRINLNVLDALKDYSGRYMFSSSVCVYRDMEIGEDALNEDEAYPAMPDNDYGWEKLYSERLAQAYTGGAQIRIARFNNCYGPHCGWYDGREKAPAALCRKAAEARDSGTIQVWGDGSAVRNYTYIDDLIDGVRTLMLSDETRPTNIGSDEYVSVSTLANMVIRASGKDLTIQYVPGTVGVQARNFSNARLRALGWTPKYNLQRGIGITYNWIEGEIHAGRMG